MDVTLEVLDGVIYNLMCVFGIQTFIRFQGIGKDFGSRFDVFPNVGLN